MNKDDDVNVTKKNIIQIRSYAFALKIIRLYKFMLDYRKKYVLSKQILKSGTSIVVNIEGAFGGTTKKDFAAKIQIPYREVRETNYWPRLLKDSEYIDEKLADPLIEECGEILKILSSIRISNLKYL